MSFSKNLTITVRNTAAQLNEPLYVYEQDRNLIMYFKIMDYKYKFDKNPTNVLASVDDIMEAYATIVDPNGYELTRRYGEVVDDEIKFVITEDLIDEIEEIGTYKLQFHIKCQHSEFTIPEISFEVLERLKGIRTVTDEGVVGDTILNNAESFIDAEGKLNLVWQRGDTISSVRLNQMVEVINNAVDEEHQRQINEVNRENRANAKLNELETRFSALTTSQQQAAEVIDARDGEASLKARLDRDIEKAKQIYVDVEGSNISTDSAAGYLKDVEILGNTLVNLATAHTVVGTGSNTKYTFDGEYYSIQKTNGYTLGISFKSRNDNLEANKTYTIIINNKSEIQTFLYNADYIKISTLSDGINIIKFVPSSAQLIRVGDVSNGSSEGLIKFSILILEGDHTQNPPSYFEGIASVGDKVEGQELYEIPVLSCGKNLVSGVEKGSINSNDGSDANSESAFNSAIRTFYLSCGENKNYTITSKVGVVAYFYDFNKKLIGSTTSLSFTTPSACRYIRFRALTTDLQYKLQLEEGTVATPYEPYVEDKLTILSPVQLEKVGDVADRVVCKDGVWGVEKNIGEIVLNGSEEWAENLGGVAPQPNTRAYGITLPSAKGLDSEMDGYSNILPYNKSLGTIDDVECFKINSVKNLYVRILKSRVASTSEFKKWLEINNMLVKYQLATPTFIPLPHDQQIRLRTFANKTNISFLTTIEGTIKAQVPKSLGATVNIQNEQISNLNKELDRVKKLEEVTTSTVETESDFTTVEATSNGYFEDVKLEGKTLVNKFFESSWGVKDIIDSKNVLKFAGYVSPSNGSPHENCLVLMENPREGIYTIVGKFKKTTYWNKVKARYSDGTNVLLSDLNDNFELSVVTFNINSGCTHLYIDTGGSDAFGYVEEKSLILLEGDHTQNPPSYFEGLKSVGDGVDEVSVESVKGDGNLVDPNLLLDTYQTCFIPRNTTFTVSCDVFNRIDNNYVRIYFYDKNKTQIDYFNLTVRTVDKRDYRTFTIASDIHYIQFKTMNVALNSSNYAINIGNDYILKPYQSDKKRLLYYNPETQVWGKPILREWDSIEKHADGKYYYHQRSGEVVLNGSEDWGLQSDTAWETDTHISFYYRIANMRPNIWGTESVSICDRFNTITANNSNYTDSNEFSSTDYHKFNIKILKSKLSTLDSNGFKQWLQANNVTAVYQLAEEKVYECTNIDLITYANETNYIVNSGAITPKSALKVHNNISNVVNLLQKKVSILESNFITMFKAVLSGDYQTLAYSLYPEDFNSQEDNSIQNNIQEDTNNQE